MTAYYGRFYCPNCREFFGLVEEMKCDKCGRRVVSSHEHGFLAFERDHYKYLSDSLTAELAALDGGTRWVNVNDRLPEEENVSLVVVKRGDVVFVVTDSVQDGEWFDYGDSVTHWQPLPLPPESEES